MRYKKKGIKKIVKFSKTHVLKIELEWVSSDHTTRKPTLPISTAHLSLVGRQ